MGVGIKFPESDRWYVRALRFANMLDDSANELSPTKINLWSAYLGAVSTAIATGFAWAHGSIGGIEHLWAPVGTWVTHAMTAHHFDKKERNRVAADMTRATQLPAG